MWRIALHILLAGSFLISSDGYAADTTSTDVQMLPPTFYNDPGDKPCTYQDPTTGTYPAQNQVLIFNPDPPPGSSAFNCILSAGNGLFLSPGNGNVGVNTNNPQTPLQVNGDVMVGDDSTVCSATTAGAMRMTPYTAATATAGAKLSQLQMCDGQNWNPIPSAHQTGSLTTSAYNHYMELGAASLFASDPRDASSMINACIWTPPNYDNFSSSISNITCQIAVCVGYYDTYPMLYSELGFCPPNSTSPNCASYTPQPVLNMSCYF